MARVTKQSAHNLDMAPGREILVLIKSVALDRHNLRLPTGASKLLSGSDARRSLMLFMNATVAFQNASRRLARAAGASAFIAW
jgi:hypothetical protein